MTRPKWRRRRQQQQHLHRHRQAVHSTVDRFGDVDGGVDDGWPSGSWVVLSAAGCLPDRGVADVVDGDSEMAVDHDGLLVDRADQRLKLVWLAAAAVAGKLTILAGDGAAVDSWDFAFETCLHMYSTIELTNERVSCRISRQSAIVLLLLLVVMIKQMQ